MSIIKNWYKTIYHNLFHLDDRLLLIIAGSIVGVCSGLAAVALRLSLESVLEWIHPLRHFWWAFLLPAAGAWASSLYLEKIAREGAGHGVPEVIYAVSRYGGLLRFRSSYSRLISSFLTIGSGGSAGPEAPVVMSGSAIGSSIAKKLVLNDRQRITLVGCGLIEFDYMTVSDNMVFRKFIDILKTSGQNLFPVIEEKTNEYKGVIQISAIRKYALDPVMYDMIFLNQIMDTEVMTASLDNDLQEVLDMMDINNMDSIPVVYVPRSDKFLMYFANDAVLSRNWHFYEKTGFDKMLYDVPHDALVVLGAYGHGMIKDILMGSKMEQIQSTVTNNLLITGPNCSVTL